MKKGLALPIMYIIALVVIIMLSGCVPKSETMLIKATDNGWDSQMLHNEIARYIVQNGFEGYAFETSSGSSTMNWQALVSGDIDLDIESWTENVATYQEDLASGAIVELGVLVPDSAQGLYVPRYVIEGDASRGIAAMAPDLKTVKDLKNYPQLFPDDEEKGKGRIYGSIPGWMADEVLYKKYTAYGLDGLYTYTRLGSEATLFASLASAYNLGEPWVGYCYEPTWVSGKLDLVLLEDAPYEAAGFAEGLTEFPKQALKIVASKDFPKKAPELAAFFEKYQTGSAHIGKALAHLDETGDTHAATAVWFLKENDSLLDQWLTPEQAGRVREALAKE